MSKSGLLARLSGSLTSLSPEELLRRRGAAESALEQAQRLHRKAALDAEQEVPGASARLIDAVENLALANGKVRDVLAAQIEAEAQHNERRRKASAAQAEKEDKTSRAVFNAQVALAREGEQVIAAYTAWWAKMIEGEIACQDQFTANARLRQDLAHVSPADLVMREITRLAITKPLPPGANALAADLSDKRQWPSLATQIADRAASVLPAAR